MNLLLFTLLLIPIIAFSEPENQKPIKQDPTTLNELMTFDMKGYTQIRLENLFSTNKNVYCEQCDNAIGGDIKFSFRRLRPTFHGYLSDNIYYNIQPDFAASVVDGKLNSMELKNAYFDISLDDDDVYRFTLGQSKIPFGFEIMQSSANRITLDRSDAINSAFKNERDLGVFFYYTPKFAQKILKKISVGGLKGYGNYGVFGIGVFNGQTAGRPELNSNKHIVAKVSYPLEIKNQILELSLQAYTGKYVIPVKNISNGVSVSNNGVYQDQRVAASFFLYPQPFGILAECNYGQGPEFNKHNNTIEEKDLFGAYVLFNYKIDIEDHTLFPYLRLQYYQGGKKNELDARSYLVKQADIGAEWQISDNLEITAEYNISDRKFEDFVLFNNHQIGNMLRIQTQIDF